MLNILFSWLWTNSRIFKYLLISRNNNINNINGFIKRGWADIKYKNTNYKKFDERMEIDNIPFLFCLE